jgi:hypothetical protein
MKNYTVLLHHEAYEKALLYLGRLRAGASPGKYLGDQLRAVDLLRITAEEFIEVLMRTNLPQIFAESDVHGDGTDWFNRIKNGRLCAYTQTSDSYR